ncbi:MAG: ABC transporter ATP-binding protein [Deltaproteobacteria bacterium HGW-Deltaproteobacteria-12]|jgi:branched-chain amino acid transport system ATP-binding protein|nr:MAG: ABC transporter ATP-binding protein [Deltaproteobacteria bacterium HGW-Deltaproteobacteria-12]
MLKINKINVFYGNLQVLRDVSLNIEKGEVVAMIGANGAGKTTIIKTISGIMKPSSGEVLFENENLAKLKIPKITARGIAQCPEGRRIFPQLTVEENLLMGSYTRKDDKASKAKDYEWVNSLFPILAERKKQPAVTLSGGEQQMLAMGRALMAKPKLMLLDEPSMGLAPMLVKSIYDIVKTINKEGISVFVVEQNAFMALSHSDRAYVLESGKIVLQGTGKELLNNSEIKHFYLGRKVES